MQICDANDRLETELVLGVDLSNLANMIFICILLTWVFVERFITLDHLGRIVYFIKGGVLFDKNLRLIVQKLRRYYFFIFSEVVIVLATCINKI